MKKKLLMILPLALSVKAQANTVHLFDTTFVHENLRLEMLEPIKPSYLENITTAAVWNGNWFLSVSGGVSAFVGSPVGCADLFNRTQPAFSISGGKWFTPAIGGRINFQGFELKNSNLCTQSYKSVHADFLWNVLSHHYNARDQPKWNIVPYAGVGIIHNEDNGNTPFAFSYGVMGQYRLSQRIHLTAELGGTTTFKDFDGRGVSNRFGDNLMSFTAGLSFTLGKSGWKRVVDAAPYVRQNEWLIDYSFALSEKNIRLARLHKEDEQSISELKKILRIEGLLSLYEDRSKKDSDKNSPQKLYPRNDYSGLNSLRSRLNGFASLDKDSTVANIPALDAQEDQSDNALTADYWKSVRNGTNCIGVPIYFFFELGSNRLNDSSQLVNLNEIARIAIKHGLVIKVSGAADSATGTSEINSGLGASRTEYICTQLLNQGVRKEQLKRINKGGIDTYSPIEANRQTVVMLYLR